MPFTRRATLALAGAALATPAVAPRVRAQGTPLRLVVGFPAGTTPDTLARLYGAAIAGPLGQPVVVDNRVGAGGLLAAEAVARGTADGNTLFVGGNGPISINRHLTDRLPFDPDRDFRPVAFLGLSQQVLVVRAGLPTDLQALIAHGRANEINYGSVGAGSGGHLVMAGFVQQTGIKAQHVPYRGAPQALVEIAAGRLDAMAAATGSALPLIREGKVIPVAISGPDPLLPEVRTFEQGGVPGFGLPLWNGVFAPRATPDAVVERLGAAFAAGASDETVRRGVAAAGFATQPMDPAAMARFIAAESARWGEIARATGVRLVD